MTNRTAKFRNPNGVYMKIMNFRRFDPHYLAQGKKGLQRGGKLEGEVWNDFVDEPDKLSRASKAIRLAVRAGTIPLASGEEDEEFVEAEEGRILTRLHRTRERNRKVVDKKKMDVLKAHGILRCEACSFDFEKTYGTRGSGFMEALHIKAVHTLLPGHKTRLSDLVLLCSCTATLADDRRIEGAHSILKIGVTGSSMGSGEGFPQYRRVIVAANTDWTILRRRLMCVASLDLFPTIPLTRSQ
jgi:predicted HNH restriction endonuclease